MADQTIRVPLGKLGAMLRQGLGTAPEAVRTGIQLAAQRGRTLLVRRSPVFDGRLRNAWQVIATAQGATLSNDAPHAGIIERGARPHAINREGIEALREWVRRKLVAVTVPITKGKRAGKTRLQRFSREHAETDPTVNAIVWAIATKMKKEGYKGTFFVRDAMPELVRIAGEEIKKAIHEAMAKPAGGA